MAFFFFSFLKHQKEIASVLLAKHYIANAKRRLLFLNGSLISEN